MSIKRSNELFGDDAGNGPRAPVSHSPAPGLGSSNRAIGYGEDLTSFAANRTTYALALNDDDLDFRLEVFEKAGLDGPYRLGALAVPGGGRRIKVDGGAVEGWSERNGEQTDVANALFRANMMSDTADGSVGFDASSRAGLGLAPGAAAFSFLDRRAITLSSPRTVFADMQVAVLNFGNQGADTITVVEGGRLSQGNGGPTDLLVNIDLIEVIAGNHRGVYLIRALPTETRAQVVTFSGTPAVFGTNTNAIVRLFRPVVSVAGRSGSSRIAHGLRVVGLPGDDVAPGGFARGALELVPGGRAGLDSDVTKEGLRYALRTEVRGAAGQVAYSGSITAQGSFETTAVDNLVADPVRALQVTYGSPGFRYVAPPGSGTIPVGLFLENQRDTGEFRGLLSVSSDGYERTGTLSAVDCLSSPASIPLHSPGAPGALVSVSVNGAFVGIFKVKYSYYSSQGAKPLLVFVENRDGSPANLGPVSANAVFRFLSHVAIGRTTQLLRNNMDPNEPAEYRPHVATVDITAPAKVPSGSLPVGLRVALPGQSQHGYLIYAGRGGGTARETTLFSVKGDGATRTRTLHAEAVTAGGVSSDYYAFPSAHVYTERPIPLALWQPESWDRALPGNNASVSTIWGWKYESAIFFPQTPGRFGYVVQNAPQWKARLLIPISGVLPSSASPIKIHVTYNTFALYTSILRLKLFWQNDAGVELINDWALPMEGQLTTNMIVRSFEITGTYPIGVYTPVWAEIVNERDVNADGPGFEFGGVSRVALDYEQWTIDD